METLRHSVSFVDSFALIHRGSTEMRTSFRVAPLGHHTSKV